MSDEEKQLMEEFGITSEPKTTYFYANHKYDRFQDALNYARICKQQVQASPEPTKNE